MGKTADRIALELRTMASLRLKIAAILMLEASREMIVADLLDKP